MGCLLGTLTRGCIAASLLISGRATPAVNAKSDPYVEALAKRLNFVFKNDKRGRENLGIEVFSLSRQEEVYSLNAGSPLMPASTIKLLTSLVALKKLGPDFSYDTRVFVDKLPKDGVLEGNLYLKGGGDPSLVTERLFLIAADVLRVGIREVRGDIIVDDWVFDQIRHDSRRIPTETDRPYNAPIGGLSFNYNSTTVFFRPGAKLGDPAQVFVEPDTGYVKIKNEAKTSRPGAGYKIDAVREAGGDDEGDIIRVRGTLPLGMSEQRRYFNIVSPSIYSGYGFKMMLEMRGMRFSKTSKVIHKEVPPSALKIAEMNSLPLHEIVQLMNKFSNNFIADALIKTIGMQLKGSPGTTDKGLEVLNEEALRLGIDTKGLHIVSGSGLTRDNRMSPHQFIQLMNSAYLDFEVLPELLASLPIAGRDGTLKKRMHGTQAFGRLRGKTGSIDGVAAITGVVQSRGGELLAFSVMMNDASKDNPHLHAWQDAFGQALAEFNRKSVMSEKPKDALPTIGEPE